jgi:hypothetical protein
MIKTPNVVLFVSFVVKKVIGRMRDLSQVQLKFKSVKH